MADYPACNCEPLRGPCTRCLVAAWMAANPGVLPTPWDPRPDANTGSSARGEPMQRAAGPYVHEWTPEQCERLQFVRWLVETGRLGG
jgi:hypothetical protein